MAGGDARPLWLGRSRAAPAAAAVPGAHGEQPPGRSLVWLLCFAFLPPAGIALNHGNDELAPQEAASAPAIAINRSN